MLCSQRRNEEQGALDRVEKAAAAAEKVAERRRMADEKEAAKVAQKAAKEADKLERMQQRYVLICTHMYSCVLVCTHAYLELLYHSANRTPQSGDSSFVCMKCRSVITPSRLEYVKRHSLWV